MLKEENDRKKAKSIGKIFTIDSLFKTDVKWIYLFLNVSSSHSFNYVFSQDGREPLYVYIAYGTLTFSPKKRNFIFLNFSN